MPHKKDLDATLVVLQKMQKGIYLVSYRPSKKDLFAILVVIKAKQINR